MDLNRPSPNCNHVNASQPPFLGDLIALMTSTTELSWGIQLLYPHVESVACAKSWFINLHCNEQRRHTTALNRQWRVQRHDPAMNKYSHESNEPSNTHSHTHTCKHDHVDTRGEAMSCVSNQASLFLMRNSKWWIPQVAPQLYRPTWFWDTHRPINEFDLRRGERLTADRLLHPQWSVDCTIKAIRR